MPLALTRARERVGGGEWISRQVKQVAGCSVIFVLKKTTTGRGRGKRDLAGWSN